MDGENAFRHDPVLAENDANTADKLSHRKHLNPFQKKNHEDKTPQQEEEKQEEETKLPPVSIPALFRYTTTAEKLQMLIACIAATIHGLALPLFTIVFGKIITAFGESQLDAVASFSKWFVVMGTVSAVLAFIQIRFQLVPAHQAGVRMRMLYLESLLRQDATFHDEKESGELVTRITAIQYIQAGIGDKLTVVLQYTSMFVSGFVVALFYSWKMTLVILATTPLLGISGAVMAKVTASSAGEGLGAYSKAGAIASEGLSMIRTVTAFGAQKEESARYDKELSNAYRSEVKKAFAMGLGLGTVMLSMLSIFGFSLWYGYRLVQNGELDSGTVFIVFFSVVIGASGVGQAGPSFNTLQIARGAAPPVFDAIKMQSDIDALNLSDGKTPEKMAGNITFRNVDFNYKSRIEAAEPNGRNGNVLQSLSLTIPAGNSQALVGPSGCGKSTIARLVERFYDVTGGQILIDGEDVRDLNVHWLRAQIGYVGQMPTLFMMSIRDNIALGARTEIVTDPKTGVKRVDRHKVSEEEIVAAAKLANADRFIRSLPEGYDTMLGERGAMLSGGQKQRICIARALVRNPRILILDEATASLDAQSERIVQEALDKAAEGRTTITIAHRLSTVKNAHAISVMTAGKIVETGTHAELMAKEDGAYRRLVQIQNVSGGDMEEGEDEDEQDVGAGAKRASQSIHKDLSLSREDEGEEEEDETAYLNKPVFGRAFRYNSAESFYVTLGLFGAAMAGSAWPLSAIILSKVAAQLHIPGLEADIRFYTLMFFAVGCGAFVGNVLQLGCLGISGERLTFKIRKAAFAALLKQDMGFFDRRSNSVGALTAKLASEASLVKGITGDTLGVVTVAISTLGVGLAVAFYGCWRVALSILVVIPGVAVGGFMEMKMMTGFDSESEKEFAKSGGTASEAVDNITTVASLGAQDFFLNQYEKDLEKPLLFGRRKALMTSIAFGSSEIIQFSIWAIAFWVGSIFVRRGQCTFEGMMMGVTGLIFGAATLGNISIFMPDVGAAKLAAAKLFHLLDTTSAIDPTSEGGSTISSVEGSVEAKSIKFEYPSRPDVAVLRGLSVSVQPGRTLALVGESGCGKSTIVSLLERFYDVRDGSVTLDSHNVKSVNVQNLRSHMGIVSQEPDLFNRTVRENICYGLAHDDGTVVTESMVVDAAKQANAHDFIMELPLKYGTIVGARGNQLSGGQKQRVAIARSIIREPRVLLLDEATSALDAESERIAQDALDKAASRRTTITIAHRLSTIKNADSIAVVSRGTIVEQGTHDELLAKGGHYAELIRNQLSS